MFTLNNKAPKSVSITYDANGTPTTKEALMVYNNTGIIYHKPTSTVASDFTGCKIMHVSGDLYSLMEWRVADFYPVEAIGVALGDGTNATGHRFCVTRKFMSNTASLPTQFTPTNTYLIPYDDPDLPHSMTTVTTYAKAIIDFNGKENTLALLDAIARGDVAGSNVAQYCTRIYSPWGEPAYIPSAGQMQMMLDNATDLNACLSEIQGDAFETTSAEYYWTSTQYAANAMWVKSANMNLQANKAASGNNYKALPVFDY